MEVEYYEMIVTRSIVRITFILLIAAILGVISSGCSLIINQEIRETGGIVDSGFLTGQPCGPPCLWGITPGSSIQCQVLDVLKEKGMNNKCEQFGNLKESGGFGIICRGYVVFSIDQEEVVEDLGFNPSEEITVGEVIKHFGKPDSVKVTASGLPEYPHTVMILYFNKIRTNIVLPIQEGITYRVEASTPIENIGYSSNKTYKPSDLRYLDWVGYGEYLCYP
jgi:hypothetical protein